VAVSLWGWWQWLRGRQDDGSALRVRAMSSAGLWGVVGTLAVAWPALALFLDHYTDSTVPWWDAFPTAASVIGQWLLARKYIENWPTWVVVNVASVALFAHKGLWLTTMLYGLFIAMSFAGWRSWRQIAGVR
jgi:nicotinamide mononucleotide transporter